MGGGGNSHKPCTTPGILHGGVLRAPVRPLYGPDPIRGAPPLTEAALLGLTSGPHGRWGARFRERMRVPRGGLSAREFVRLAHSCAMSCRRMGLAAVGGTRPGHDPRH